ncbi:unnamed protein product [Dibothriocephalus latus]|uniref:C2 domain-containing protein n=1 Tax=Dibothriocephalus latus TaxID=60516 RepID=A0A3P7LB34_DIBLA|nr:unnamed protein product [Dibothriocephalus latus]
MLPRRALNSTTDHATDYATLTTELLNVTTTTVQPLLQNGFLAWASRQLNITNAGLLIFVIILICIAILLGIILLICCCRACCRKAKKRGPQYQRMPSIYKDQLPGADGDPQGESIGTLEYSLEYSMKTNTLKVGIIQGMDLVTPPGSGTVDPFVKVRIKGMSSLEKTRAKARKPRKVYTTDIQRDTTCPVFNSAFTFNVPYEDLKTAVVHFVVYDADEPNQPLVVGGLDVKLESIPLENYCGKSYETTGYLKKSVDHSDDSAQICTVLTHDPVASELSVNVLEAKQLDLPDYYRKNPPETMVSVTLHIGDKKLANKKTQVRRGTLNPYFGETLKFQVEKHKLIVASLTLKVKYRVHGVRWRNAGKVVLGADASDSSGRKQWEEMLANPRRPVGMWQPLIIPEE